MATYKEIAAAIKEQANFTPKPCWIAHVKAIHGLTKRQAYNRKNASVRRDSCPESKRPHIEAVLRKFKMIP